MGDQLKTFLQVIVNGELTKTVKAFCKRNGLLTLSVIAVATGCMLGFMLRGTQMSTQVGLDSPASLLTELALRHLNVCCCVDS